MKNAVGLSLLAVVLLGIPSAVHAQALGTIAGVVKDASDAVLPGVVVEASSPALIEKTRAVTTDGRGQFTIVNLPPGAYNVTFSLTGFAPVNRQGIDVSIGVTASLNIAMRLGNVAETITVSGETPMVDLKSTAQTTSANAKAFKELPTGGSWVNMAQLIPAVNSAFFGARDVGGLLGDQTGTQVSVHGGLPGDGVSMIDGMRIGNMYLSSNLTNMSLSPLLYDEVNISFSGQNAESGSNGVLMNAISKSGGNSFRGSFLINGAWPALQGSNVTSRLNSRGVQNVSNSLKKLYDINGAVGGPIKKDKVWFYFTSRYFTNDTTWRASSIPSIRPLRYVSMTPRGRRSRAHGRPTTTSASRGHQPSSRRYRAGMPTSARTTRTGCNRSSSCRPKRRNSSAGRRSSAPLLGRTPPRASCFSRRASRRVPAPTPSCSRRRTSPAFLSSSWAAPRRPVSRSGRCSPTGRHGSTTSTTTCRRRATRRR